MSVLVQFVVKDDRCITPCPFNQKFYISGWGFVVPCYDKEFDTVDDEGIPIKSHVAMVGSEPCDMCKYHRTSSRRTIKCLYEERNK